MEIAAALITVAGNLAGVWFSHYLRQKDQASASEAKPELSRSAVLSFVTGLIGFIAFGLLGIVAVVAGHRSLHDIRESNGGLRGLGLARAGLILGYLSLALIPLLLAPLILR